MTYPQLLERIKAAGFEQWSWVVAVLVAVAALASWLFGARRMDLPPVQAKTFNSANAASNVGQQIGGTGNTVAVYQVYQHDPATALLAKTFVDAVMQRDQALAEKDKKILELSLENQKLRMEAAFTVATEALKPRPTRLATLAKAEMLQGNLDAVNRLLTHLAASAAKKVPLGSVEAARYASQRAAIWVGRDTQKAAAAFESAYKLSSSDVGILLALVDLYVVTGDSVKALARAKIALAVVQGHQDEHPQNSDWTYYLSVIHTRIGNIYSAQGRRADALGSYKTGLTIMTGLVKSGDVNNHWLRELSVSHERIGILLDSQGEHASARESWVTAMKISKELAGKDENNIGLQHDLSCSYERRASAEANERKFLDAIRSQQAALVIRSHITKVEAKNKEWQHSLAIGHLKIGEYKSKIMDQIGAFDSLCAGLRILQELGEADPVNTKWKRSLLVAHGLIGGHLTKEGKFKKACESYLLEVGIAQSLVGLDEKNVVWLNDLAKAHLSVGVVQSNLGQESSALVSFFEAKAIFERLFDLDTASVEYQLGLVTSAWSISCLAPGQVSYEKASVFLRNAQLILARSAAQGALPHTTRGWSQTVAERLSGWQRLLPKNGA